MPAEAWLDLPYLEAVQYLLWLQPTPKTEYDRMAQQARDLAFTVSRVAKVEVLQEVLDSLREAASTGMTLDEFVKSQEFTGLSDAHLEVVYRTNLQSAFGRGSYDKLTDPTLGGAFWGWRYNTVGDERVRESHRVMDGLTFRTGTAESYYPPWDFNCRCSAEPITNSEARRDALVSDEIPAEAQDALATTDFRSPALRMPYSPDMGGIDVGLAHQFFQDRRPS